MDVLQRPNDRTARMRRTERVEEVSFFTWYFSYLYLAELFPRAVKCQTPANHFSWLGSLNYLEKGSDHLQPRAYSRAAIFPIFSGEYLFPLRAWLLKDFFWMTRSCESGFANSEKVFFVRIKIYALLIILEEVLHSKFISCP